MNPLNAIFSPRNIALIGASERPDSIGKTLLQNLTAGDFRDKVIPVNPFYDSILGLKCYPHVAAFPGTIDLAVIATPAETVPEIMNQCVAAGVQGAIILSSGFREAGPGGKTLEEHTLANARRGNLRIIGPNSLGIILPHIGLNTSFINLTPLPGQVAFISQSGALCSSIIDWSLEQNVGFSAFVSIGDMADVDWADLINHFSLDPRTGCILLYLETLNNVRAFISAAREASLSKPIIILKAGKSKEARLAAKIHIGGKLLSPLLLNSVFFRSGVLQVETVAELFYMAEALSKSPNLRGSRVAILTNGGGPSVLAVDSLVNSGSRLAELREETRRALDKVLPQNWSRANPVDIRGDATPERYRQALEVIARESAVDGILIILTPQAMTEPARVAEIVTEFQQNYPAPVICCWMGGKEVEAGRQKLREAGLPTYNFPDTAARVFSNLWRYSTILQSLYRTPKETLAGARSEKVRAETGKYLDELRQQQKPILTAEQINPVLESYFLPPISHTDRQSRRAGSANEPGVIIEIKTEAVLGPIIKIRADLGPYSGIADNAAVGLPPLTTTLAQLLIKKLKYLNKLNLQNKSLEEELPRTLVRLASMATEQPLIRSLQLRLRLEPGGSLQFTSANLQLIDPKTSFASLPAPVIRPYPLQYIWETRLKDGAPLKIRPIRPEDELKMIRFHQALSDETVYFRYFRPMTLQNRISHDRLSRICYIDYDRDMILVVENLAEKQEDERIIAVGRLSRVRGQDDAEFAIVIRDAFQRQGLGSILLEKLVEIGKKEGIRKIFADILPENKGMQKVAQKWAFTLRQDWEEQIVKAERRLI